jgi:sugar phosphate isomerase/epimerase
MLLALATGTSYGPQSPDDLERHLAACAAVGFEGVTLPQGQVEDDPGRAAAALARSGVRCVDIMSLAITRDEEATMAAAQKLRPLVEALAPSSILTNIHTRVSEESIDRTGRVADLLGVPLALEVSPSPIATIDDAAPIVLALGTDRAVIMLDSYHFFRAGSTWEMLEQVPLDLLGIVQFNDALAPWPPESANYMTETTTRRAWPGQGELPLERFVSTLRDRGWDGPVAVEVFATELAQLPIEEFARLAYETSAPYWL